MKKLCDNQIEVDRFYSERIMNIGFALVLIFGVYSLFTSNFTLDVIFKTLASVGLLFELVIFVMLILEDYQKNKQKKIEERRFCCKYGN